jgi:hypothetical protein
MNALELEPEVLISGLRGEGAEQQLPILDRVLGVMKARASMLVASGQRHWDGEPSVVVVVPSSEVLSHWEIGDSVQVLARLGRAVGIHLRLIDAAPPLREAEGEQPAFYPMACFGGSTILREFAAAQEVGNVTFHQVSPREMVELAENA